MSSSSMPPPRPMGIRRSQSAPKQPPPQSILKLSAPPNSYCDSVSPPKQARRSVRLSVGFSSQQVSPPKSRRLSTRSSLAREPQQQQQQPSLPSVQTAGTSRRSMVPQQSIATATESLFGTPSRRSSARKPNYFYAELSDDSSSPKKMLITKAKSTRATPVTAGKGERENDDSDKDADFIPNKDSGSSETDEYAEEDESDCDNSPATSDDIDDDGSDEDPDFDGDLSELEDEVENVDPADMTIHDFSASPAGAAPRRRQSRRPRASIASPMIKDSDIRLPSLRGAGGRKSAAPLDLARQRLQARELPKSLPCRDEEFQRIFEFVESTLRQGIGGGCLYISGVPGTGKTATVMEALRQVDRLADLPEFDKVLVNGMKVTEPRRVYSAIVRQLYKIRAPWQVALRRLKAEFTTGGSRSGRPCVLLVDELDMLCTKRQDVLYNLFDWPQHPRSRLVVLAIANTMDLPERVLMHRVASRLGFSRLVFQSYRHEQLTEIVKSRLTGLSIFDEKAVELAARKVAAASGDARRALDLCSRSCDLAEKEFHGAQSMEKFNLQVGMQHVRAAISEMFAAPTVTSVSQLSVYEKLCMSAVLAERLRTGLEENPAGRIFRGMLDLARLKGQEPPSWPMCCIVLGRLHLMRLLLWEGGARGQIGRVCLNCAPQDVELGLKDAGDEIMMD